MLLRMSTAWHSWVSGRSPLYATNRFQNRNQRALRSQRWRDWPHEAVLVRVDGAELVLIDISLGYAILPERPTMGLSATWYLRLTSTAAPLAAR